MSPPSWFTVGASVWISSAVPFFALQAKGHNLDPKYTELAFVAKITFFQNSVSLLMNFLSIHTFGSVDSRYEWFLQDNTAIQAFFLQNFAYGITMKVLVAPVFSIPDNSRGNCTWFYFNCLQMFLFSCSVSFGGLPIY